MAAAKAKLGQTSQLREAPIDFTVATGGETSRPNRDVKSLLGDLSSDEDEAAPLSGQGRQLQKALDAARPEELLLLGNQYVTQRRPTPQVTPFLILLFETLQLTRFRKPLRTPPESGWAVRSGSGSQNDPPTTTTPSSASAFGIKLKLANTSVDLIVTDAFRNPKVSSEQLDLMTEGLSKFRLSDLANGLSLSLGLCYS